MPETDIEKIDAGPKGATLTFRSNSFANPARLVAFVTDDVGRTKLRPDHTFVVRREWTKASDRLRGVSLLAAKLSEIAQTFLQIWRARRMNRDGSLFFEDFEVGQVIETGSELNEEEIIEFGLKYAPVPYHTDPGLRRKQLAVCCRWLSDCGRDIQPVCCDWRSVGKRHGFSGVDSLRWKRPVKAGDTLRVIANILELSPADKEGGRDAVRIRYDTFNQNDDIVMTLSSLHFVRRRPSN